MFQIYFAQMSVCVNSSDIELANKFTELSVIPISYLDLVIDKSVIGSMRYDLIIRSHINYPVPLPRKLYPYPLTTDCAKLRWFDSARLYGFLPHTQLLILIPERGYHIAFLPINTQYPSKFCRRYIFGTFDGYESIRIYQNKRSNSYALFSRTLLP